MYAPPSMNKLQNAFSFTRIIVTLPPFRMHMQFFYIVAITSDDDVDDGDDDDDVFDTFVACLMKDELKFHKRITHLKLTTAYQKHSTDNSFAHSLHRSLVPLSLSFIHSLHLQSSP